MVALVSDFVRVVSSDPHTRAARDRVLPVSADPDVWVY